MLKKSREFRSFNTQPPEGGWVLLTSLSVELSAVSTHSRLKAAGYSATGRPSRIRCFNTQPPEGGWKVGNFDLSDLDKFQHTAA